MAVNIVTGMTGIEHITSHDDRARNASQFGRGKYVFDIGRKFSATAVDDNLVRIQDGMCINQGTQMGIEPNDYVDVEIDNGLLGTNRHDIIVMRYEKNEETLLEKASLAVVKGVNSSEPVDPDVTEGNILDGGDLVDDMPLYRVVIEGVNLVSVEPLFEVFDGDVGSILEELEDKVDKVAGKGLSTNDYTNEDKAKVDGIPTKTSDLQNDSNFVSDANYVHTDNNYTDADKEDVAKIEDLEHSLSTTKTATGNPISISDSAHVNAEELTVELEPKQDLHGYDSPWVGGAGKNLLPIPDLPTTINGVRFSRNDDGSIEIERLSSSSNWATLTLATNLALSSQCIATCESGNNSTCFLEIDAVRVYQNISTSLSGTIGVAQISVAPQFSDSSVLKPMLRLATETDPTFEPYSNICPISGYDETSVVRSGKNKCESYVATALTEKYVIALYIETDLQASTTYAISFDDITGNRFYANENVFTKDIAITTVNGRNSIVVTTKDNLAKNNSTYENGKGWIILKNQSAQSVTPDISKVQLELGSTATSYEPYTADTYTLQFGDTVYGAEVDFVSGVATVKYGYADLGDLEWAVTDISGQFFAFVTTPYKAVPTSQRPNFICSEYSIGFPTYTDALPLNNGEVSSFANTANNNTIFARNTDYSNATDFKTAMNGVQLVYELATPYTIRLTPQQIKMLKGNNVLVADGDMDLEYQVDNTIGDVKEWAEEEFLPKNSATAQHNYSTQEQVVGTWIDGSTLYEKTIIYTNTLNSNSWTTIASLTGVSIKKCEGVYRRTNNRLNMFNNTYISNDQTEQLIIGITENNINVYIGSMFIPDFIQIEITIRYTKTTD